MRSPFDASPPGPENAPHTPSPNQLAAVVIHYLRCLVSWILIQNDMSLDDVSMLLYVETHKLRESDLLQKQDWAHQPFLASSIERLIKRWFIVVQDGILTMTPTGQKCTQEANRLLQEGIADDITALKGCWRRGDIVRELPTLVALRQEFSAE